jgi:hypothetical protein
LGILLRVPRLREKEPSFLEKRPLQQAFRNRFALDDEEAADTTSFGRNPQSSGPKPNGGYLRQMWDVLALEGGRPAATRRVQKNAVILSLSKDL